ncbi:hypothetical protein B0O99DRAFT_151461 [Bisporella sp. PMI_857]|nr:hypothetical protein B0O99DRAFT_151461 [Bisporella sp. PMI_857]
MWLNWFWYAICVLLATSRAKAQSADLISMLPKCGLTCVIQEVPSNTLASGNLTTIASDLCTNRTLQKSLSSCMFSACNDSELLKISGYNQVLCEGAPAESRVEITRIVGVTFGALAVLAVLIRCYSRYAITKGLQADDFTIVAAAVVICGIIIVDFQLCARGFGLHVWNVNPKQLVPLMKIFYYSEMLYVIAISLVKVSILLFYHRVFVNRNFRILNHVAIASVAAFAISITLVIIFQCWPVYAVWDRMVPHKCINMNALTLACGSISVAQDVFILLMPLPQIICLHMDFKKRMILLSMFSVGTLACVTSVVRLKYMIDFGHTQDPTWDNAIPAVWSVVELSIATICACLPSMRALLARWLPRMFDISSAAAPANPGHRLNNYEAPYQNSMSSLSSQKKSGYGKLSSLSNTFESGTSDPTPKTVFGLNKTKPLPEINNSRGQGLLPKWKPAPLMPMQYASKPLPKIWDAQHTLGEGRSVENIAATMSPSKESRL